MPRRTFVIALALLGQVGIASASDLAARLDALAKAARGQPRLDAAKAVIESGPEAVPELIERLHQPRPATDADRRALLKSIRAEVPNPKGVFTYPGRPDKPNPVELDWLAALSKLPEEPSGALAEALE